MIRENPLLRMVKDAQNSVTKYTIEFKFEGNNINNNELKQLLTNKYHQERNAIY